MKDKKVRVDDETERAAPRPLSRRQLLAATGAAAVSAAMAGCSSDDDRRRRPPGGADDGGIDGGGGGDGGGDGGDGGPLGPADLFQHGVASGDPLPNSVILWTRVTPDADADVVVSWEMTEDPQFSSVVREGEFTTNAQRDFTVKVDAGGLEAGRTYYYRFSALGRRSVIGRTRTAPSGAVERLRLAVASCSNYTHGYFHAYAAIAARRDLDAVIHLGDYIYEYANGAYGNVRAYEPLHEILTLDDYRTRHALYKRDADLQEAHRQHPFICIWDDHEVANNAWLGGAENHDEGEGDWSERKAAATRAYAEWLPIREQEDGRIFRKLSYGDLAELILLDTRHWGRNQPDLGIVGAPPPPDPERSLLGDDQAVWLEEQLSESSAQWKLIGQQVMLANLILGIADDGISPALLGNLDQWQGYPESRERFVSFLESSAARDVVILTGDIHASFANEIVTNPNDPEAYDPETGEGALAVEFVTPAITSQNLAGGYLMTDNPTAEQVDELVTTVRPMNPHVRFTEITQRGYLILDVNAERVQSAWFFVEDVTATDGGAESFAAAWSVASGSTHLVEDASPAAPAANPAELAP